MKYLAFFAFLMFFSSCQRETFSFEISNETDYKRVDEPVFIEFDKLPKNIELGNYSVFVGEKEVPFQLIDKNGDGKKDNLFLLININKKETLKIEFKDKTNSLDIVKRANVRFGEKKPPYNEISSFDRVKNTDSIKASELFLMEGPAWENDKVAFRNYYDQRNGIDIFGKRVERMVLDSVGIEGTNYHELSDWGMDILKVGNSLGAGAIALQINDTIYPIRDLNDSHYTLLDDGPIYASLKLEHKNVKIRNNSYNIEHIISIYGGTNYYLNTVTINGLKGDEKLVTGIVNIHSEKLYKENVSNEMIFATYDLQAEDKRMLGMSIVLNDKDFSSELNEKIPTKGIDNTFLLSLNIKNNNPVSYRFYFGWETGFSSFRNFNYFSSFIKREAQKKSTPLRIIFNN